MTFELQALPWDEDALAPHISAETIRYHYHKHHAGYLNKLNKALSGKIGYGDVGLEQLIRTETGDIYNLAAQCWNHDFYWRSMSPKGGGVPALMVNEKLSEVFGSVQGFKNQFAECAANEFGSGWVWLLVDKNGSMRIESSTDAQNPLRHGHTPLLTLDVWEHAYYLDYQNLRASYIEAFLEHLINWDLISQGLSNLKR